MLPGVRLKCKANDYQLFSFRWNSFEHFTTNFATEAPPVDSINRPLIHRHKYRRPSLTLEFNQRRHRSPSTKVSAADGGGKGGRKRAINWTSLTWRTFTIIALFNNFQFQANLILPPTPTFHLLRIVAAVRGTYHDNHAWLELFTQWEAEDGRWSGWLNGQFEFQCRWMCNQCSTKEKYHELNRRWRMGRSTRT